MKNQALFASKDKKKTKCRLLQFLFGALRVSESHECDIVISYQSNWTPKPQVGAI